MTCQRVDAVLDEVVAGDHVLAGDLALHLTTCDRCQAVLAAARKIEVLLAEPPPAAPATFAVSVLRRVRREAWRAEQLVDRFFNAALVVGAGLVVGGIWMVLNLAGLTALFAHAVNATVSSARALSIQNDPHLWTYLVSLLLIVTGASAWWWIDNETSQV
jgi:hypothetical protein